MRKEERERERESEMKERTHDELFSLIDMSGQWKRGIILFGWLDRTYCR